MKTELLDATDLSTAMTSIGRAAILLRRGEIVAFPTETVYGLGANAFSEESVRSVFAAKGRPADNPLIVHVATPDEIFEIGGFDSRAVHLAQRFMPGPITLVLPSQPDVPPVVRAGLNTVAVRVPSHPVASALLSLTGPLVAPSANRSGRPSPTTARDVLDDLDGRIAAVLNGGVCLIGIESTVVDLSGADAVILRPGVITAQEIALAIGEPVYLAGDRAEGPVAPRSPGMKYRHYAPSVPVRLVIAKSPPALPHSSHRIVLTTAGHLPSFTGNDVRELNEGTLYRHLRDAEAEGADEVVIYAMPGELSGGLLDRVQRASGGLNTGKP